MCGRYNLVATGQQIMDCFSLLSVPSHKPDYNIPPGQKILEVVQLEDSNNRAVILHWSLIPSWSKDRAIASRLINAGAETLTEKPSFKNAFRYRRYVIPAPGFFEWQPPARASSGGLATYTPCDNSKQPYHIHRLDRRLFAMAGIWEHWEHNQETV